MQDHKEQNGFVSRLTVGRKGVATKYSYSLTEGRKIVTPEEQGKRLCVCKLNIGSKVLPKDTSSSENTTCPTCGWAISTSLPPRTNDHKPAPTMSLAWGYGVNNGPDHWHVNYTVAKEGKRQSPINISTKETKYSPELAKRPLRINYVSENEMELENTGHSVKAQIKGVSELSGGPLEGTYRLEQFHLHWGSGDAEGSEHTIDKKEFAAELHLVHYNTKYGTFGNAADKPDGLAVFGFMVKVGKSHDGFEEISKDLGNVLHKGKKCKLADKFDPTCLISNLNRYWTYLGSLTTPPLYESVTWIVFQEPLEISSQQIKALRELESADGGHIVNNFRRPCPIGTRIVHSSFE